MAISLTTAYLAELKKGANTPIVVLEIALDSGTLKFGTDTGSFSDVQPVIKSVSSLQNKLDTNSGFATLGQISFVISGRDNFKNLIKNNYLKNRRVTRKDGFAGTAYADYAPTFTGTVLDWSRKGDDLTVTVADDAIKATKKIPAENSTKTQNTDYRNMNPVDIMQDILATQLGIASAYIDTTQFDTEQALWLSSWIFDRVLTTPSDATKYLQELQQETNSFIVHDGEKITFKVFAPPVPGQAPDEWTDARHILKNSLSQKSGYDDGFFNRVVVYYNYDESGSEREDNFDNAVIAIDSASQSIGEWDEVKTKTIKSKWIRTLTYSAASNITGLTIYHLSSANINSSGDGTLQYTQATNTLTWRAPSGTAGEAVTLSKNGKYQVYDADKTKFVRILVVTASLPVNDQSDTIVISTLNGATFATNLASQLLRRYRYPVSTVSFSVDINNVSKGGNYLKPTDLVDLTTDEASEKGETSWNKTRLMLTGLRPDFAGAKIKIDAIDTGMTKRYGFIAPAGYPDYATATDDQREYAFIGRASDNNVNGGSAYVAGYYIW